MSPDPNALTAASANEAVLNNQTLQRKSARDKVATVAAQATVTAVCFDTLIGDHLHARKSGANRGRHFPNGTIFIGRDSEVGRCPEDPSSSLAPTRPSQREASKIRRRRENDPSSRDGPERLSSRDEIDTYALDESSQPVCAV